MTAIKFGTDGWRAVIAEDFTFANARIVAQSIARYVVRCEDARKGVIIGYDHRFASDTIAAAAAEVLSASGTPIFLTDKPCPTPAVSLLVRQRAAAGGLMITASHNPYQWNGIKYKASYGSSALPSIIAQIEKELAVVQQESVPRLPARKNLIQPLEPRAPYLDTLEKLVDWKRLRGAKLRFVSDVMHGSAAGLLVELFRRNGVACDEIRGTRDPRFGGVHPEPIEPHIEALRQAVLAGKFDAGLCADGDGDRIAPSTAMACSSILTRFLHCSSGTWRERATCRETLPRRSPSPNLSTNLPPSSTESFMKRPSASSTSAS